MDERIAVTYRRTDDGWEPVLSTGERLGPSADLVAARAAVRDRLGAEPALGIETVQVPLEGHGVGWAGLRFELLPPLYGADAPTPAQNERLTACFEYYRARVPAGMRVECAGNRVRVDPSPSGLQADLFAALDGTDEVRTTEEARRQLREALEIEVPAGFVRVAHDYVGLEEFGDVGHLHLVLAERWPADAPCF
ncbi:hypothetical protein [Cryptosporangium aurantiacum]|uniref:Uncharacterized protein n=1 Tax=Cryptosporangium aurantiacum TaxID=134849 RepID=A0A1M7RMY8_9ACTN|nr:hypothetical protein [Cryptosporangium aurantiacum]SHN47560.1 hypothetical protein SAMN05443668_12520 [Cryptosporangium aurantiacum]